MRIRDLGPLFLIMSAVLAAGCEPVRTTAQVIRLRLTSSASGQPAPSARVELKCDYRRDTPQAKQTQHLQKWWNEKPWHSALTAKDGQGDVAVKYSSVDRTWGSNPPPSAERVVGKPYLVRITGNGGHEEFSVIMQSDASVKGRHFSVSVLEIREPKYIDSSEWY
jgi:hypothetical protein